VASVLAFVVVVLAAVTAVHCRKRSAAPQPPPQNPHTMNVILTLTEDAIPEPMLRAPN
jgi:hypothetical protein